MPEQKQPDEGKMRLLRERMANLYHDDEMVNALMEDAVRNHVDVDAVLQGQQTLMPPKSARKWLERTKSEREQAEKQRVSSSGVLPQRRGDGGRH